MFEEIKVRVFDRLTFMPGNIVTFCYMEYEDKVVPVNRVLKQGKPINALVHHYTQDAIKLVLSDGRYKEISLAHVENKTIKIIAVSKGLAPTEEEK
ncbi:hypothetical protein CPT_Moonbeam139 [Bacillus phage Moonbeam]|uniref:Uncharacterized protein n=1 Tax=Bacillus phage Moonbeam TaxID=1540091 RepID=A0A0A0RNG0_9CAUD|nr:hypothetical protein CPT_Moonbeam139 [Bacillus phage Moonbeam]AIW03537.1 hypothetical protein CPT_Moonbeam139 [Bacillus phage Moonbeam]